VRLSDADRERMFAALSRHAAQDTISLQELERRIERLAAAQTREEAAAVLADLPPLSGDPPAPEPSRAWGRRGHGHADAPDPSWRPTPERFRDTRTGAVMRVWEDASGGRHYVPD
jgi:hypothetical protein